MLGLGLVGGLFGGSDSDGPPPLPEAVLAIRKAGDKTNMSEHTTNRLYDYVNPASDRVKQHEAPVAIEPLDPSVKNLCAALR